MTRWLLAALAAGLVTGPGAGRDSLTLASSRGMRTVAVREERGWPVVAAAALAGVLDVRVAAVAGGQAEVTVAGRRFDFVLGTGYFRFGGQVFALAAAPYLARDTLFLPLQWVVEALPRLLSDRFHYEPARDLLEEFASRPAVPAPAAVASSGPRPDPSTGLRMPHVVAVDAGHGGPDVGMEGPIGGPKFLREKDVTLAVAKDVAADLRGRGIGVVMTRTTDTLISLEDRGRIALEHHADLFVSIHVNAANPRWTDAESARGFSTYFLAEAKTEDARRVARLENASLRFEKGGGASSGDPMRFILNDLLDNEHLRESSRLAQTIERSLARVRPGEARGVKQAGFVVLATSNMPAVLVELGFGTNRREARYLVSAAGQRQLAGAIARAVVTYLVGYERRLPAAARAPAGAGAEGGGGGPR